MDASASVRRNSTSRRSWRGQAYETCGGATKHLKFKCKLWKCEDRYNQHLIRFCIRRIIYNIMVNRLSWAPCTQGLENFFSEAHQVMNRHRLGSPFGISPESLDSQEYYEKHFDLSESQTRGSAFPYKELEKWRDHLTRLPQNGRRMLEGEFTGRPPSLFPLIYGSSATSPSPDLKGGVIHTPLSPNRRATCGKLECHKASHRPRAAQVQAFVQPHKSGPSLIFMSRRISRQMIASPYFRASVTAVQ